MPFQMHRLFITILIIQKRRCGDSDLTPGLTGSSVGSLATRESAPQPPPVRAFSSSTPFHFSSSSSSPSFKTCCSFSAKGPPAVSRHLLPSPFPPSTIYNATFLSADCQIAQHHVLQGRCSYCGGNRDLIAK